jgi:SAM-dependent methyltransferase
MSALFERLFPGDQRQRVAFHREVAARLPATGRVLDLGCGRNLELADYRTAQREVWGTDLQVHPRLSHPEWFRPAAPNGIIPFPDGHFDLVAACWVLEHVRDPSGFVQQVGRVLRPGGSFIALTVSGHHYVTLLNRAAGVLPDAMLEPLIRRLYEREPDDRFRPYYRLNTARRLERACQGTSLELEQIARFADQGYFRFSRLAETAAMLCDWSLERVGDGWGRIYMTVVARKTIERPGEPLSVGGRRRP